MEKQNDITDSQLAKGGVIALIILGIILWMISTSGDYKPKAEEKPSAPPVAKASFTAELGKYQVVNPATLVVQVKVKNTSKVEGKLECAVGASDSSKTYKGFDYFTPDFTLKPGEESSFNARLTITKEGAFYVTQGHAECKADE